MRACSHTPFGEGKKRLEVSISSKCCCIKNDEKLSKLSKGYAK